jgi:hypothetical protein
MNQHSSTDLSASSPLPPDAISRRAYELWESEGRPEGADLRHWLQAEQELNRGNTTTATSETAASNMDATSSNSGTNLNGTAPSRNSDVTPLQGTRAAAAAGASAKRGSGTPTPFGGEKANGQSGRGKKATPAL